MTYEVQQTRWDQIIRRVSGSIGPGSRVSETLSELFPVVDVERVPGELLVLGGTHLAWGSGFLGAVAGNSNKVQLFNPEGSKNILTVTRVDMFSAGGIVRFTTESSPRATNTQTARFRDSRLGVLGQVVGQVRTETGATAVPGIARIQTPPEQNTAMRDDNAICTLGPNTGFVVGNSQNNETLLVTFWWRERPAQESELQF